MNKIPYVPPEIPAHEEERLQELYDLNLLDTAAELRFDRYTNLVAEVFAFPVVLISLVDRERQWFKSALGWELKEAARDISFCGHALNQRGVMVVPDARADPRFAGNPLVTGPPHIRFYAGALVHGPGGHALGTLCVIDHQPHQFEDRQCLRLRQFADLVENEIKHSHDLQTLRASVEFSAYYDPLTRLPNRRLLMDRLAKLLELEALDQRQVAVLVLNVSGQRLINQALGTEGGDELLRQLGRRLSDCCPAGGSVARLQADEFVLAFPVFKQQAGHLDVMAEQVRTALNKPFSHEGGEHYLRVQIGGSLFPDQGDTPEALIEKASAAIRFTSDSGPGAVRFFTSAESESLSERVKIESCLHGALTKGEFHLVYQPIISLSDGKLASTEALLRWESPQLGVIGPDRFIPIAEEAGLIVGIGHWVQQEVCRQLQQWRSDCSWNLPLAINASAAELAQPNFARDLLERLQAAAIPGELLTVEVTEFSLVSDSPTVNNNLDLLKDAGVRVSIDDFGTGYSSLSYLRHLPVSSLKIDRSFINGLPEHQDDVALTRTIISMAQALGLSQVAEGIETRAQLEFLCQNHCQYGQGYLISRPVEPEQIPAMRDKPLV